MQAPPCRRCWAGGVRSLWRATCWLFNQKAESGLMSAKWASVFSQRRVGQHARGRDGREEVMDEGPPPLLTVPRPELNCLVPPETFLPNSR